MGEVPGVWRESGWFKVFEGCGGDCEGFQFCAREAEGQRGQR